MASLDPTQIPKVAVIGAGYWGRNLVRNHHQLGALKVVCDPDDQVLLEIGKKFPDVETTPSFGQVLARTDIQALVIASPAANHYLLAKEGLLAGKHVFVEKPLSLLEQEAKHLVALAKEKGLILMVGHLLQYHPAFIKLKEMAAGGELGRINYIYSNRLNLGKIRREENILWSFAPHDVSMILTLAHEEPSSVVASGSSYLHREIADVTTTHMVFPSGLCAHIFVSWLHPFKEQKLVVVGEGKMAVLDDTQPWPDKLLLYPHTITWQDGIPIPTKAEATRIEALESEPLRNECEHFLACVATGQRPLTDGEEGLRVLRVLNAAQRSLDQSSARVSVAEPAKPLPTAPSSGEKGVFVHPTAIVDDRVTLGCGTKIWHFSHVLSGSRIGENCNLGQNVVVGPDVTVGNRCKIQNNVSIYRGVTLEDGVFCGPSMVFTNVYRPRAEIPRMDQLRPTLVKRGASIGANVTIVCGATLGRYCFIGAGAVINANVQDHALVVGVPARHIGWVCECGARLADDLTCPECDLKYQKSDCGLARI